MSKSFKFLLLIFVSILVATPIISVSTNFRRQTGNICYDTTSKEARSTTITLSNNSGTDISLAVATSESGDWTINCDPNLVKVIKNGTDTTFSNESSSWDVKGSATYIIGYETPPVTLTITWVNPLIGSNNYGVALLNNKYSVETPLPGNGNNALYQVIVN